MMRQTVVRQEKRLVFFLSKRCQIMSPCLMSDYLGAKIKTKTKKNDKDKYVRSCQERRCQIMPTSWAKIREKIKSMFRCCEQVGRAQLHPVNRFHMTGTSDGLNSNNCFPYTGLKNGHRVEIYLKIICSRLYYFLPVWDDKPSLHIRALQPDHRLKFCNFIIITISGNHQIHLDYMYTYSLHLLLSYESAPA